MMKNVTVFTIGKQIQAVEGDWLEVKRYQSVPVVSKDSGVFVEDFYSCERWNYIEFNKADYKFPHYDYYNPPYDTTYIAIDPELEHILSIRFREQIQNLQQEVDLNIHRIKCLQQEVEHKDSVIEGLHKRYNFGLIGLCIGCSIGILWKLFM